MKITDVKAYVVDPSYSPGDARDRPWTFVRIDTDEGVTGWGEATNYPGGGSLLTARTVNAVGEVLIGEDPADIEPLWHRLYRRYTYLGSRGLPTTVISGIDIALWDIKGKALGRPVYDLLGGKFRDDVRLYANGWFFGCETPEDYARAAKEVMLPAGHDASKLDPFLEMRPFHTAYVTGQISQAGEQLGYDIVAAVREAVGPQHEILIDAHGHYNVPTAVRLANTLYDQSRIEWFEEPLPPESFEGLRQVRQQCRGRASASASGCSRATTSCRSSTDTLPTTSCRTWCGPGASASSRRLPRWRRPITSPSARTTRWARSRLWRARTSACRCRTSTGSSTAWARYRHTTGSSRSP